MSHFLKKRGILFVISSPSGAGKTSITRGVLEQCQNIHLSISYTTRPPRPGEESGKHYHFVDTEQFKKMVEDKRFIEFAEVFDNFYGTPKDVVLQALENGESIMFDIDWQGMQQIKASMPNDVVGIFILPPSYDELQTRLNKRAQDSEEVIAKRMKKSTEEMRHWVEYDYVVVNQDLEQSIDAVMGIIASEQYRRSRYPHMYDFVRSLSPAAETNSPS